VIDINPGAGVWSKTLHETLRPRRHVLVESALQHYEENLGPLLNRAGSAYRYAANLDDALDPDKGLLSEYATENGASSGQLPKFNESLLVTVNLSGRKVAAGIYQGTLGKKFFDDLYFLFFTTPRYSLFRYGLVRILAWMPEDEGKGPFIPRTVCCRMKSSIILETMADVTEVVNIPKESVGTKYTKYKRWPKLDIEEHAAIDAGAKESSAPIPLSRQSPPPAPDLLSIEPTPRNLKSQPFNSDATWVADFLDTDARLRREDPKFYRLHAHVKQPSLGRRKTLKTTLQAKWARQRTVARTRYTTHKIAVDAVNEGRRLIAEWKSAVQEANGQPLEPALDAEFRARGDEIHSRINAMNRTNRVWAEKALDDCRAADMSPPLLLHSRRKTHPLVAHEGEFEPAPLRMAFLDVVPYPDLLARLDSHDKMVCYRHIMAEFSIHLAQPVADALKWLVHEAGLEAFVKTIPGIHDPTKGGWYDLKQLRLRALPAEMFVEIALAYEKWPFRTSTRAMLLTSPDPQARYSQSEGDLH
jgi:mitochondrial transcription factor 1